MKAIILAAGHGRRMKTNKQKVMHHILGNPLVQYVAEACAEAGIQDITLVVNSQGEEIRKAMPGYNYAIQTKQLGTGHAVQSAAEHIHADDDVLILYGDMPLITADLIKNFINFYMTKDCAGAIVAVYQPEVGDFGRVYIDEKGMVESITEVKDMTAKTPPTDWGNPSIYMFKGTALKQGLKGLKNNNNQEEFYLTDVPQILRDADERIYTYCTNESLDSFVGINTQAQLAEAASIMRSRINLQHMENGVQIMDPATTYIDKSVEIAADTIIYPGCILEGTCKIEPGAIIGPYTHMKDTVVGKGTAVRQSVLTSAKIGENTEVGPFAYLRPGAAVGDRCRVGNFVEIKNAILGNETKMAHLAYIGDADVGSKVNIGCGVITANYDGKKKHRSVIRDGAFIGSNANLIAPIEIGEGAFIAAGSTITEAVPDYSMGIARERQTTKENWVKKKG
ncbi:MAG: bifunctional UDP-N-acetylglucosamine diphosphorylase/glucosamine-1-phosphate N-acetyltransferase GlmU [Defluviitaleaceae bacterium]|nr:bifunctional UDP-N-acetylglucosamine diphosphorylase/glucosamine-1-phosphate N-acetyltransferase GlmU [Defluviitaleaceae bacterium]